MQSFTAQVLDLVVSLDESNEFMIAGFKSTEVQIEPGSVVDLSWVVVPYR